METEQFAALLAQFTRIADALEKLTGSPADGLIENLFRAVPAQQRPRQPQPALPGLAAHSPSSNVMPLEVYRKKACGDFMLSEEAAASIAHLAGVNAADLFHPVDYSPAAAWLPFFVMSRRAGLDFSTAELIMSNSADTDQAVAILHSRQALKVQAEGAQG